MPKKRKVVTEKVAISWITGEEPTLRDRFAMAALTGLLGYSISTPKVYAQESYEFADAMLEERKKVNK